MDEFDAWQKRLLSFALEHGRACTEDEWRWLKYVYDMERLMPVREELSLAADGETLNVTLARESAGEQRNSFRSTDGTLHVEVTIRPRQEGDPTVHVRVLTDDRKPVAGAQILFPGRDRECATDGHGRLSLDYHEYLSYLQKVMFISCVPPNGERQRLVMD